MPTDTEISQSYLPEVVRNEAQRIAESYLEEESYHGQVEFAGLETDELEQKLTEAVDGVEIDQGYDRGSKVLMASGAAAGSAGAVGLLTGNPLWLAPLLMGGGNYLAGWMRKSSRIKEVETRAFLQDSMHRNLEVEEKDGFYEINFEY